VINVNTYWCPIEDLPSSKPADTKDYVTKANRYWCTIDEGLPSSKLADTKD